MEFIVCTLRFALFAIYNVYQRFEPTTLDCLSSWCSGMSIYNLPREFVQKNLRHVVKQKQQQQQYQ